MKSKTRTHRTPLEDRRQTILAFRWLIALTSLLLMIYGAKGLRLTGVEYLFIAFLVGSNLALTMAPIRFFTRTHFIASVFGLDIVLLFLVIYLSGGASADLYALYFLVVFLALPARSIPVSVMVAFFASLLYGVVTYSASGAPGLLQTSFLIKIPFFFAVTVFGNLMSREARVLKLQQDSSSKLTEGLRKRLEETTKSKDKLDSHLRLMQNYNEGIVNSIEIGVMVMDLSAIITAFNPAAEEITGVRRDDVFLKKSNTNETLQTICSLMEQSRVKPVRRQEVIMKTASGENKIIGISVYPLKHKKERVVGTVAIFTDLTEIVELRKKVRESEKSSIQQEVTASFVHDLKKPLSSIQRLSQLILSDGENRENRDKYAAAISKGIVGIVRTIKEISTPSKDMIIAPMDTTTLLKDMTIAPKDATTPSKDMTFAPKDATTPSKDMTMAPKDTTTPSEDMTIAPKDTTTPSKDMTFAPKDTTTPSKDMTIAPKDVMPERNLLDANALVQEVVDFMKVHTEENGSSVTWNPGKDLPRISGDREQLKNMFFNLVQDSVQALGVDGEIQVSTSKTAEGVSVEIKDNGPGITRRTQARSFNPFLPTKTKGAGLGLPIARKIAADYGGTIHVHNEPGRGPKFTVNLSTTQPQSSSKADVSFPPLEKQTVLVADDDNTP